jgi:hypothetical protein
MEIQEKLLREAEIILRNLQAQGISFEVSGKNDLRAEGVLTDKTRQKIRLWKAQIIELLSPKCENCTSAMMVIEQNEVTKTWFCPLGCKSMIEKRLNQF